MSIDRNHPDYIDLRSRIRENPKEFIVIVGAGLSRPYGLPSWTKLRDNLVNYAKSRISEIPEEEKDGYKNKLERISVQNDLWKAFSDLKRTLPHLAYVETIRNKLTISNRNSKFECYDLIWKLGIKGIISFNIDTCTVDSFAQVNRKAVDTATAKDTERMPQFLSGNQQFVFQPHGIINDESTWVFTEEEKTKLLGSQSYIDFMKSICQNMHLLIIGFNPADFAFTYFLQHSLSGRSKTGSKHYLFLPDPDNSLLMDMSEKGFATIPYTPDDHVYHTEILDSLKDILTFIPKDNIPGSVYLANDNKTALSLAEDELLSMPIDKLREYLNTSVSMLIPPSSSPSDHEINKLEKFYKDNIRAIHMAWLVNPDSKCNILYGHKINYEVGRGAFGQVYEGENISTGNRVAIKILLPEVRHEKEYLNSFRRGVRSMRILTEKKFDRMVPIITAYEIPACIIMEYIDGPTLSNALDQGYFKEIGYTLEVLIQIGEVVHAAHNLEELVLHRDLKPDNVILKDCFNKNDTPNVIVVDFDLSWHKGAQELSVVFGARAQGYAAPEQTASGRSKEVSTRNTAVDAFGYGMLGYYLFVGTDPRPNEQNFKGYEEKIKKSILKRFSTSWKSLPSYLAHLIQQCTFESQSARISLKNALDGFKKAKIMALSNKIVSTDPLILEEIAANVSPDSSPKRAYFAQSTHPISDKVSSLFRGKVPTFNCQFSKVIKFSLAA